MRVGFDARWYNESGVGTYVAELLKAMAPLQRDVDLVIYQDPENPVPGMDGQSVERIPVGAGKYSLFGQVELAWRCKRDGLDVLHSPFYALPVAAPCPIVVSLHDLVDFRFNVSPQFGALFWVVLALSIAAFQNSQQPGNGAP
jgi:Glycosyltransferase Family 4